MRRSRRTLPVILAAAVLFSLATATTAAAQAAAAPPPIQVLAYDGFGTPNNDYAWSMAWFDNKLYVGTARSEGCVEGATEVFYYPTEPFLYSTQPTPGETCPANEYQIDLQAQIWSFEPSDGVWTPLYNSPQDIPNPLSPGNYVAQDIGFRGMAVYDGALYVGDVTPDEYIPELAHVIPPRILRTTDGVNFTPIPAPASIDTYLGVQDPIGFRAMTVFNNQLYVTATSGLTGDGVVLQVNNPGGADPTFTQVTPSDMQVFELQTFNGYLYAGDGSSANAGYSVYKTAGGASPTWTPVVTDGAGAGAQITSVVSMGVFNNQLYVGSSGWYNTAFPGSEMIVIYPDNNWDLVAGTARTVNGVLKYPLSGLPDGMGNPFNAHFWRMDDWANGLITGTNDWSYILQDWPVIGQLLSPQYGFDVYGTCDGRAWFPLTYNAFGAGEDNFGARSMITAPDGTLYLGSANHAQGTTIFGSTSSAPSCPAGTPPSTESASSSTGTATTAAAASAPAHASTVSVSAHPSTAATPARPSELLTDVQGCGTVVSWEPTAGAARYKVLRSTPRLVKVPLLKRTLLAGGAVPDDPPPFSGKEAKIKINGPPKVIATTSKPFYIDRGAVAGSLYDVVAEGADGSLSAPSNVELAPSLFEPATFANAWAGLIPAHGSATTASAADAGASALLGDAQAQWNSGDRAGALAALAQLDRTLGSSAATSSFGAGETRADMQDLVYRLQRRLQYAGIACQR